MSLSIQPIQLFGTSPDKDGALVLSDGCLVAVFLHLSFVHGAHEGSWFVEWGSSPDFVDGEIFPSLERAVERLAERIKESH